MTTRGHVTIYRYRPEAFQDTMLRVGIYRPKAIRPFSCSEGEIDRCRNAVLYLQRRNEMLGLGVLGTIIVILAIVWLVRRV